MTLVQRLKSFRMACLRKIKGVTRRGRLRNTVIQERLGWTKDIIARICKGVSNTLVMSFKWSRGDTPNWHQRVKCMERNRGRPKRRWLYGIMEDVESLDKTIQQATRTAQDQATRRRIQKQLPLRASRASTRQVSCRG